MTAEAKNAEPTDDTNTFYKNTSLANFTDSETHWKTLACLHDNASMTYSVRRWKRLVDIHVDCLAAKLPHGTPVSSTLPQVCTRIKVVNCLRALVTTPFADGINALCWPRTLPGDFREVVDALPAGEGIVTVDETCLAHLPLSDAGKAARDILSADLRSLRAFDLQPSLDCVHGSLREEPEGLFHTDVHSWHVDTATVPADTYLCTYVGATSEGLRNDETQRRVDLTETRAELLRLYGGEDDAGFLEFLAENFYDLHYVPLPGAQLFSFGLGNLWRIAIEYPGRPVPPCIHRAPLTLPGMPARLLLIS